MVSSMRACRDLGLVLACLALYGCAGSGNATPGTGKGGKRGGGGGDVPVTVVKVERKDVPVDIHVIGNVEAYSTISVKAQVGGVLDEVDACVRRGWVAAAVGHVVDAEQEPGHELDDDQNHCDTAEIAVHGGRVVGYPAVELRVNRLHQLESVIEPNAGPASGLAFSDSRMPAFTLSRPSGLGVT